MRPLVGPHVAGQWANKLDILRQWQPPLVLVLSPELDKVQQLRAACPDAVIVGRFYHDDSHYADNIRTRPKGFALDIHREIIANPATPLLDYVQSNNETNQDWQGIQQLNVYTERWMSLADESQAYKCAILAFSVGNPDLPHKLGDPAGFDGRMLYWQQVLPSLNYAQRNGHILALHAYGYPDMFHPDADWYIYRYERQVEANLKALGITNLKYAYTEIGIDRLIVDGKGGYKVVTNDQDYVNQLLQWERDLQGQPLLLGGAIFTFGDSGGWDTYDIASTNVASMLAAHYEARDQSLPTPEQDDMSDTALPQRDWDNRLTQRGVTVETPDVKPGQKFWRVVKAQWFDEQQAGGRHHIYIEAPNGTPFMVTWPSGTSRGNANGKQGFDAGNFPMSASLDEFWVSINDGNPSENVKGIGMGANGNPGIHTSTLVTFQLTTMPQAQETVHIPVVIAPGPTPAVPQEPSMPTGIIEPRVAQAILQVESGGRTHGNDGRTLIRFEAHIFKGKLGNDALWANYFKTDPQRGWVDQQWRRSPGDPWRPIHTGAQADEYAAFEFARGINADAAYQSISMGAPQAMGFNHARLGYPSARTMFESFEDAQMQTIGFINFFLSDPALMEAARRKDWREIARRYNGSGQVDYYAKVLREAYEALA